MLLLSPRLRVYYRVTVVDVSVERIDLDGTRHALATPGPLQRLGHGYWRSDEVEHGARKRIDRLMRDARFLRDAPPGTRFQWLVRWSENSARLDQRALIVRRVGDANP